MRNPKPKPLISKKNVSIFTSEILLYGSFKKEIALYVGITITIPKKKSSNKYFIGDSSQTSQVGSSKFLLKSFFPNLLIHSPTVPIGQIQLQKDLLKRIAPPTKKLNKTSPAGWITSKSPVASQTFNTIKELIGRNPSTADGLSTNGVSPSVSKCI